MPFNTEGVQPGIRLALVGWGLPGHPLSPGPLWRLNELGTWQTRPDLQRVRRLDHGRVSGHPLGAAPVDKRHRNQLPRGTG